MLLGGADWQWVCWLSMRLCTVECLSPPSAPPSSCLSGYRSGGSGGGSGNSRGFQLLLGSWLQTSPAHWPLACLAPPHSAASCCCCCACNCDQTKKYNHSACHIISIGQAPISFPFKLLKWHRVAKRKIKWSTASLKINKEFNNKANQAKKYITEHRVNSV